MREKPSVFHCNRAGPIKGPRLPHNAWRVLDRESITTINQLRAVTDDLKRLEGIGPKTARAIQAELARVVSPDAA